MYGLRYLHSNLQPISLVLQARSTPASAGRVSHGRRPRALHCLALCLAPSELETLTAYGCDHRETRDVKSRRPPNSWGYTHLNSETVESNFDEQCDFSDRVIHVYLASQLKKRTMKFSAGLCEHGPTVG